MPGLVNSHLHFYHTMHRGLAPEDAGGVLWSNYVHGKIATKLTPEDEIYGGLIILLETLKSGTTTYLEAGSYNPAAAIEGVSRIGMRGLMGRRSFDQAILGHCMLMEDTDTCLRENEKFLKIYRNGYNGGLLKACVDIVGRGDVRIGSISIEENGRRLRHGFQFPSRGRRRGGDRNARPTRAIDRSNISIGSAFSIRTYRWCTWCMSRIARSACWRRQKPTSSTVPRRR